LAENCEVCTVDARLDAHLDGDVVRSHQACLHFPGLCLYSTIERCLVAAISAPCQALQMLMGKRGRREFYDLSGCLLVRLFVGYTLVLNMMCTSDDEILITASFPVM
jgi:hypothetical protein